MMRDTTVRLATTDAPPRRASNARWWRSWVIVLLLMALTIGVAGAAVGAGLTYRDLNVSMLSAQAHLQQAEALGKQLSHDPFDNALLLRTHSELAAAEQDFLRAQADADRLAAGQIVPKVGLKVQDGRAMLDMAVTLTDGGQKVLEAASPVMQGLKAALSSKSAANQAGSPTAAPLTTAQLNALQQAVTALAGDIAQAQAARQRIPDNGAALGATAANLLARYDQLAPTLSTGVNSLRSLLAAAPTLLGTDHPASYLIEILDETELRAGGGFIGNYGTLTVAQGRLTQVTVRDTYLLDGPYLARHTRPFPSQYSWFPLASSMGLRDSNLSPDFAQNAQYAEKIYGQESGQQISGVVAITPAFIARLLTLTGPVVVPGYQVTVTSQNLVPTIHHFQFQTNAQGVPSSDGVSSTRKHFTAVLGETVFARLRTLPAQNYGALLTLAQDGLKSKDLQFYVNEPDAQKVLSQLGFANALPAVPASGDMLALVDDNIGGNKAGLYLTQAASEDITILADGSVRHTLHLAYSYAPAGSVFGSSTTFVDEVQIYVPKGSVLSSSSGLDHRDAPHAAGSYTVFGGRIALTPYTSRAVVLQWTTPKLTAHTYHLIIDRQAGSLSTFAVAIHLPSASSGAQASPSLTFSGGTARYATNGPLNADLQFDLIWH